MLTWAVAKMLSQIKPHDPSWMPLIVFSLAADVGALAIVGYFLLEILKGV